ncbi:hypothetical protein F5887DRAFT_978322 [Amanita rubescens]|nr:hypothetical protein F5887DRAFT_978322 [Amanita rubescens]
MGKLIWHQYARYVSIVASFSAVWASYFGFFYRKFFWDFFGGILRNPGGLQPSPGLGIFIMLIVEYPVVQSIAMALGLIIIALEYPLPIFKPWSIYRSFFLRILLLSLQFFFGTLYYQGAHPAIGSLVAIICYIKAIALREKFGETGVTGRIF